MTLANAGDEPRNLRTKFKELTRKSFSRCKVAGRGSSQNGLYANMYIIEIGMNFNIIQHMK